MSWWMWLITLYWIGAVWYTAYIAKYMPRSVDRWYKWIVQFVLWPIAWFLDYSFNYF